MAGELQAALADIERTMAAEYDRLRGAADTATEIANRCSLAANKAEARVAELEAALAEAVDGVRGIVADGSPYNNEAMRAWAARADALLKGASDGE